MLQAVGAEVLEVVQALACGAARSGAVERRMLTYVLSATWRRGAARAAAKSAATQTLHSAGKRGRGAPALMSQWRRSLISVNSQGLMRAPRAM